MPAGAPWFLYALGAVCYELIAGRTPHGTEEMNPREAVDYVLEHDPTPIPEVADEPVPRDLERIIRKALHRSRDQRYQTTQEFARDLELYLARRPVSVTPHRGWYVARLFATRHRFVVAVGALTVTGRLAGLAGGFVIGAPLTAAGYVVEYLAWTVGYGAAILSWYETQTRFGPRRHAAPPVVPPTTVPGEA